METADQRVMRRVKKINKQIAEQVPMFADFFATTPDREAENLRRIDQATKEMWTRQVELAGRQELGARFLQIWAADELTVEDYCEAVMKFRRLQKNCSSFYRPEYRIDYWRTVVRNMLRDKTGD